MVDQHLLTVDLWIDVKDQSLVYQHQRKEVVRLLFGARTPRPDNNVSPDWMPNWDQEQWQEKLGCRFPVEEEEPNPKVFPKMNANDMLVYNATTGRLESRPMDAGTATGRIFYVKNH